VTCNLSSGTLNLTHSLTHSLVFGLLILTNDGDYAMMIVDVLDSMLVKLFYEEGSPYFIADFYAISPNLAVTELVCFNACTCC